MTIISSSWKEPDRGSKVTMQLKRLTLSQVRPFEEAEFDFQPGMNLLVGINGAGKSTVLDALRIMLSQTLPKCTASKSKPIPFSETDIYVGQETLKTELSFEVAGIPFLSDAKKKRQQKASFSLNPFNEKILKPLQASAEQPFSLYFSTYRSLPTIKAPNKQNGASDQTAATRKGRCFDNALDDDRGLRLRDFAEWWLRMHDSNGSSSADSRLAVLNNAITSFLDGCTNLRAVRSPEPTLLIDKEGSTLDVRQLSDGERSIIALVFELAQRLVQANPNLSNPLQEGKAVVLIDDLDLHLHPRWQRTIVHALTATFPNCQFIATTHSPQIIGELSPSNIILIENGKTYRPYQSFGMDTNWILGNLMGVTERDAETLLKLAQIEELIEDEQYDSATAAIDTLRAKLGEFPELVGLQTRIDMIEFLSDEEEEDEDEVSQ